MKTLIVASAGFDDARLLAWAVGGLPWRPTELMWHTTLGATMARWAKRREPGDAPRLGVVYVQPLWDATLLTMVAECEAALVMWDGNCSAMQQVIRDCSERQRKIVTHVYPMASKEHFPA